MSGPSRLLLIPSEIRLKVLRFLLIQRPYIYDGVHVDARIVRVNRQLHDESLPVLYGENYFRVKISSEYDQEEICFRRCEDFTDKSEIEYKIPLYKLIRRYDIYVELSELTVSDYHEIKCTKSVVRKVVTWLSGMPQLQHLCITLGGQQFPNQPISPPDNELVQHSHTLEPFRLLRNVGSVDIQGGVSTTYARYLKNTMEGQTPVDHLPRMYSLFEDLVGSNDEYSDDLQRAIDAMSDEDAETFKKIRTKVVTKFVKRTQRRLNQLQRYDADTEHDQWVIRQERKSKRQRKQ